jgi:hypothetical protein
MEVHLEGAEAHPGEEDYPETLKENLRKAKA